MTTLPRDSFGRITSPVKGIVVGPASILSNAAHAAERIIKSTAAGQRVLVSDLERDRRMEICKTCEFFNGKTCLKCGCVARWKTKLATEKCPVDKW